MKTHLRVVISWRSILMLVSALFMLSPAAPTAFAAVQPAPRQARQQSVTFTTAGTGPGGVGAIDGSSDLKLWLNGSAKTYSDSSCTTPSTNGGAVKCWTDNSGYYYRYKGSDATLLNGEINSQPVIKFGSAFGASHVLKDASFTLGTPYTVLNVGKMDGGTKNRLLASDSLNWLSGYWSGNEDQFYANGWVYQPVTAASGAPILYTASGDGSLSSFYRNGSLLASNSLGLAGPGQLVLGGTSGGEQSDAKLAEVIAYSRVLNSSERALLDNYLAARYALTISDDHYAGDLPANGDYDLDVAGIGKESDGSSSEGHSAGLMLQESGGSLTTGSYVIAGHKTPINSWVSDNLPGGMSRRWARVWYLDKTGSADVSLGFDFSEASNTTLPGPYHLLYSSSSSLSFTDLGVSSSVSGDQVSFNVANAGLQTGYYTLGVAGTIYAGTGPGGVGLKNGASNLRLWLDGGKGTYSDSGCATAATGGDAVQCWADQSGYNFQFKGSDSTLVNGEINTQPVIKFGTAANAGHIMSASSLNLSNPYTLLTVSRQDGTKRYRLISSDWGGGGNNWLLGYWDGNEDAFYAGGFIPATPSTPAGGSTILYSASGDGSTSAFYRDGTFKGSSSAYLLPPAALQLGGYSAGEYSDGKIAEVIGYTRVINSAERALVDNYLAARYGLTISDDYYAGDTLAKGDYDFNVAGIGRESDGANRIANSAGLILQEGNSSLSNGEYLIAGQKSSSNAWTSANVPSGLSRRWTRVWYLDKTGSIDAALGFDFSDAGMTAIPGGNYHLIYSPAGDYSFSDLGVLAALGGDQFQISLADASLQPGYYTLAEQPANALSFDGQDDYVQTGLNPALTLGQSFTLESWVYPRSNADYHAIAGDFDHANGIMFGWPESAQGGWVFAAFGDDHALLPRAVVPSIPLNQWSHVAAVFVGSASGTGSITVYLNGVQAAQSTWSNHTISHMTSFALGRAISDPDRNFDGQLDEFRAWSVARSESQIRANMYRPLGPTTNLQVAYHLDETGSASTAPDSSGQASDGALNNFSLPGAWRTSGAFSGPRNALNCDGTDDYVLASLDAFPDPKKVSLELWVSFNSLEAQQNLVRVGAGVQQAVLYKTSDNKLGLYVSSASNTVIALVTSTAQLADTGVWHHLVGTWDSGSAAIYLDGQLVAQQSGYGDLLNLNAADNFSVCSNSAAGVTATPGYVTNARVDEVRIWDAALSPAAIRDRMNTALRGDEDGLMAYLRFDQLNDAGQTVVTNLVGTTQDGSLLNSDPTTAWVSSTPFNTWIGGQGSDWSSAANWSRGAVPGSENVGVYSYPGGSDATLSATSGVASLFIADGATLNAGSQTLNVSGNWFNDGVFAPGSGTVNFTRTGAQFLVGDTSFNNLGVGAAAILQTSSLISAGGTVTRASGAVTQETRAIGAAGAQTFGLAGISLDVTTQGDLSQLVVTRTESDHPAASGLNGVGVGFGRYWHLEPTGCASNNCAFTLTLPHAVTPDSLAQVCRYTGGLWNCNRSGSTASTVWRSGLTGFSDWAMGTQSSTAVNVANFTYSPMEQGLRLVWSADGSNAQIAWFQLRRTDSPQGPFEDLPAGLVAARASGQWEEYGFEDRSAVPGVSYRYQLVALDGQGREIGILELQGQVYRTYLPAARR